jgi:hypothetical protein
MNSYSINANMKCLTSLLLVVSLAAPAFADQKQVFEQTIQPVLKQYCLDCHSTKKQKGDLDLERFTSLDLVKRDPVVWEHSLDQIRDKEMPPKGKPKPSPEQTKLLTDWVRGTLDQIALANAGDPGPWCCVGCRTWNTPTRCVISPASSRSIRRRSFPSMARLGEGFTNAGAALGDVACVAHEVSRCGEGHRLARGASRRMACAGQPAPRRRIGRTRLWRISVAFMPNTPPRLKARRPSHKASSSTPARAAGALPLAKYLDALQGRAAARV